MNTKQLWLDCGKNVLISCAVFAGFFAMLYLVELWFVPAGTLLQFDSLAFCVGIPASVIGVGHILTIRDPKNYIGFYPGLIMEALQAWQFYLLGRHDLMVFYIIFFIPLQIISLVRWKKSQGTEEATPAWSSWKGRVVSVTACLFIVAIAYLLSTFVVHGDSLTDHIAIKLFSGLMMASAILANYGLIYHKIDAWVYWLVNSVAGLVLYVLLHQSFNVLLFVFFIVINTIALISWIRPQAKK